MTRFSQPTRLARFPALCGGFFAFWGLLTFDNAACAADDARQVSAAYDKDIKGLIRVACYKCHGPDKQKGDLNLSTIGDGAAALAALKTWHDVAEKVQNGEMPPKKSDPLAAADKAKLLAWIKAAKATAPADPGRVTIRRLNRAEYNNVIRDLTGLDLKPSAEFPEDDVGDGFDNIGDVLTIPPLLMEKYLIAADQVLEKALITEQPTFHVEAAQWSVLDDGKERAPATDAKNVSFTALGEVRGFLSFPVSGRYTVKIKAGGDQAGNEPVMLGVKVDDKLVAPVKVLQKSASVVSVVIDVKRGMRPVAIAFMNPFNEADAAEPLPPAAPVKPGAAKPATPGATAKAPVAPAKSAKAPRVRALTVESFDLIGPPTPALPESHRRIMIARPDAKTAKRDAAKSILEAFATRAYRRPITKEQGERLLAVFDVADKNGEVFGEAVRLALKGVLVSPAFLFRIEVDRPGDAAGIYKLDDYDIASRLSFFLWSSLPDEALLDAAKAGKLGSDPSEIERQVARMLKDPKSRALIDNFFTQWLGLRKLSFIQPDSKIFPEFSPELRKDLYDEVIAFVENLMREDRSVLEILDADYSFLNARLAKHYGLPAVPGTALRKVKLTDANRGGVVTMGGILAITSLPTRTSPVKRGKWILEQILGDPPPPPPPMVEALDKGSEGAGVTLTVRQRLERHRADPVCASCHERMDPIGFGLENFDGIGRWRDQDAGNALDTSGVLPSGQQFKGPIELRRIFAERKEQYLACLSGKLLTFALGRGVELSDEPAIQKISDALEANQYRFSVLVTEIAKSYPFLYRKRL